MASCIAGALPLGILTPNSTVDHLADPSQSSSEAAIKADQAGPTGKPGKELQDATVKRGLPFFAYSLQSLNTS
jgi:hypothetical protein